MNAAKPSMNDTIAFRPIRLADREALLSIAAQIWEGHDYLPLVFERWVREEGSYFAGLLFNGRLAGCGRLHPFDARIAWCEGLRVDPEYQRHGLGAHLARHVVAYARDRGLRELMFVTYFANRGSMRISERLGFRRSATFTNFEAKDLSASAAWARSIDRAAVHIEEGLPGMPGFAVNDWFFVPPEVADRGRYLPGARTLRDGKQALVVAPNTKYPHSLEIGWFDAIEGRVSEPCLAAAILLARDEGFSQMHAMAPAGTLPEPFLQAGFAWQEAPDDVYLYRGRIAELSLEASNS
ncbi:MAG: GNAT family N-acetyltransferase [Candidatus Eisenbacteria bacterium]|nr:GNAT family N-acetyltransferase [Candidatus Eisenbacteria bacterium]